MVLVVLTTFVVRFLENKAFSEAAKTCVVDADKSLISVYENNLAKTNFPGQNYFG
jgi:hypothetical protein